MIITKEHIGQQVVGVVLGTTPDNGDVRDLVILDVKPKYCTCIESQHSKAEGKEMKELSFEIDRRTGAKKGKRHEYFRVYPDHKTLNRNTRRRKLMKKIQVMLPAASYKSTREIYKILQKEEDL